MQRRRSPRRIVVLGAIVAALLAVPSIAQADCGDQIVDEVFNTGSVEGAYALRCYDLAISKLEGDAEEYSEARGIISSAKIVRRNQLANEQEPGTQEQPAGQPGTEPERSDSAEPADAGDGGGAGPSEGGGAEESDATTDESTLEAEGDLTDETLSDEETLSEEDVTTEAAPASFDDGDDGGTPLPVLLLGGAAIVLIGIGAGGLVWRRVNGT
jgi:hypothetical protein